MSLQNLKDPHSIPKCSHFVQRCILQLAIIVSFVSKLNIVKWTHDKAISSSVLALMLILGGRVSSRKKRSCTSIYTYCIYIHISTGRDVGCKKESKGSGRLGFEYLSSFKGAPYIQPRTRDPRNEWQ